jgi:hypothetical protein
MVLMVVAPLSPPWLCWHPLWAHSLPWLPLAL